MTAGNASPLNDGASAVLIASRRGAAGRTRPARPDRRPRHVRRRPRHLRHRPGRGGQPGAQARRHHLGRRRRRRAQRGVRGAVARVRGRVAGLDPERVNANGGAIAHRPPARRVRRRASSARSPTTLKANGWQLRRRRDLHRRRPGPRGRAGDGVTTSETTRDEPSAARLPGLQVDRAAAPEAAADRAPAPADRAHRRRCSARTASASSTTTSRASTTASRWPADHRPRPRQGGRRAPGAGHAGRDLAGQRRRPLPPPRRQLAVADRPELHRRRAAA